MHLLNDKELMKDIVNNLNAEPAKEKLEPQEISKLIEINKSDMSKDPTPSIEKSRSFDLGL